MRVICPETGRFQFKINIEEYISDLERLGVEQQTPIIINIPCRGGTKWDTGCKNCSKNPTFYIYKDRFKMEKNECHNKSLK